MLEPKGEALVNDIGKHRVQKYRIDMFVVEERSGGVVEGVHIVSVQCYEGEEHEDPTEDEGDVGVGEAEEPEPAADDLEEGASDVGDNPAQQYENFPLINHLYLIIYI